MVKSPQSRQRISSSFRKHSDWLTNLPCKNSCWVKVEVRRCYNPTTSADSWLSQETSFIPDWLYCVTNERKVGNLTLHLFKCSYARHRNPGCSQWNWQRPEAVAAYWCVWSILALHKCHSFTIYNFTCSANMNINKCHVAICTGESRGFCAFVSWLALTLTLMCCLQLPLTFSFSQHKASYQ